MIVIAIPGIIPVLEVDTALHYAGCHIKINYALTEKCIANGK